MEFYSIQKYIDGIREVNLSVARTEWRAFIRVLIISIHFVAILFCLWCAFTVKLYMCWWEILHWKIVVHHYVSLCVLCVLCVHVCSNMRDNRCVSVSKFMLWIKLICFFQRFHFILFSFFFFLLVTGKYYMYNQDICSIEGMRWVISHSCECVCALGKTIRIHTHPGILS